MVEGIGETLDPRIRRTRRLLQQGLGKLLESKEFEKISVQDIADAATVNRATFYDHYADKFALLECLVASRFQELLAERNVQFDGTCASALKAMVLAVCGVVFKSFHVGQYEMASSLVYLAQGWVAVIAVRPLIHSLGWHGLMWMGAGGIAYTLGIFFFALDRLRYFHALWHLFVLAGSVAHYFAILFYVVPARP